MNYSTSIELRHWTVSFAYMHAWIVTALAFFNLLYKTVERLIDSSKKKKGIH